MPTPRRKPARVAAPVRKPRFTADDVYNTLMKRHKFVMERLGVAGTSTVGVDSIDNAGTGGMHANLAGGMFPGRSAFMAGGDLDQGTPGRNIKRECGYPQDPKIDYFRRLHDEVGLAQRVNFIWPDECWSAPPEVWEDDKEDVTTPFEKKWNEDIVPRVLPWTYLHRVDRLSGIGRFGVLFFGLADLKKGEELSKPAPGIDPNTGLEQSGNYANELLFLRAFDESKVTVKKVEDRDWSPRLGSPTVYTIDFGGIDGQNKPREVHWTRILHVADNRESSEWAGVERCRPVIPELHNIRKVSGSSAEMFWKGGFPGYQFKTWPDLSGEAAVDEDAIEEEIEAYQEGLQRYLSAVGGEWASLAPQVADPTPHVTQYLTLLGAAIGVPVPILLGNQSGHLAGLDNTSNWKGRVGARQLNYCEPMLARPFFDRLFMLRCSPRPKQLKFGWRDLMALSDKDRADIALKLTQAMMQFVQGGCEQIMPLIYFYAHILQIPAGVVQAIIDKLESDPKFTAEGDPAAQAELEAELKAKSAPKPQGGGRTGNPGADPGRPRGSVEGG